MSQRVIGFVENWVSENVLADGSPAEGDTARAKSLADRCLTDALAEGFSKAEIEDEFDDLAAFMSAQIIEANERAAARAADEDAS